MIGLCFLAVAAALGAFAAVALALGPLQGAPLAMLVAPLLGAVSLGAGLAAAVLVLRRDAGLRAAAAGRPG